MLASGNGEELTDTASVDAVLRELDEAAQRWEALVAQAETVTFSVDLGDIYAVANSDGKLIELVLHPSVTTDYTHGQLAHRLNIAFSALRQEAQAENDARFGSALR